MQNTKYVDMQTRNNKKIQNVNHKIPVLASAVFADQSRKSEARPKINRDIVGIDLFCQN